MICSGKLIIFLRLVFITKFEIRYKLFKTNEMIWHQNHWRINENNTITATKLKLSQSNNSYHIYVYVYLVYSSFLQQNQHMMWHKPKIGPKPKKCCFASLSLLLLLLSLLPHPAAAASPLSLSAPRCCRAARDRPAPSDEADALTPAPPLSGAGDCGRARQVQAKSLQRWSETSEAELCGRSAIV